MSNLTKKALYDSFFKLLNDKPFKKITVSDVASDCGINRMTFYYHFKDLNDLVEKAFEDSFTTILKQSQSVGDWSVGYLNLFLMVLHKKNYVIKLYPEFDTRELVAFLFPLAFKLSREAINECADGKLSPQTKERLVHSIACCMVGTFLEWLEKDMEKDPHELVNEQKLLFEASVLGIHNYMKGSHSIPSQA